MPVYYNAYNGMDWSGLFLDFISIWPVHVFVVFISGFSAISRYRGLYLISIIFILCLVIYFIAFHQYASERFDSLVQNGEAYYATDDGCNGGGHKKWCGPQAEINVWPEFVKAFAAYSLLFMLPYAFVRRLTNKWKYKSSINHVCEMINNSVSGQ
jgi:hypothetical protein